MIDERSRLTLTSFIKILDPVSGNQVKPIYPDLRPRVTETAADDQLRVVTDATQWSHLAQRALGDARFWWVIADLSHVVDPFADRIPGKSVRIPSAQRFLFRIMAGPEVE